MSADDTDNRAHPNDWDTQRERLSAYLDDQLAPSERAALERHLPTCARCADELAELRRTVALLRAMPTPALPRSFALPVPAAAPAPAPVATAATRAARRPTGAHRAPRWPGLAQWAGGLAAAAGIVLVLGSALAGGLPGAERSAMSPSYHNDSASGPYGGNDQGTASTASPARVGPQAPATAPPSASGATCATPGPATPTIPGGPCVSNQYTTQHGATPSPAPATPTGMTVHNGQLSANGSESAPPVLPIAGGGLAVAGLVVFALGRRARRR